MATEGTNRAEQGAIEQFGQWFWSNPIEPDPEGETVDEQEEEGQVLYLDKQAGMRYSLSQSTSLRPTPPGSSSSAPTYRNALRFQMEYLGPTTITRSQMSRLSIDPIRRQPQSALCFLNSTIRAHNQPSVATLTHSPSAHQAQKPSRLMRLRGKTT